MDCDKTAGLIEMLFGMVGRMGPGMRQVVGFGNRCTGRGVAVHCTLFVVF